MKSVEAYRIDIEALTKRIADIKAKATVENRDLTVDEIGYLKKLNAEITQLMDTVSTLEEGDRITASLAAPAKPVTVQGGKHNPPAMQKNRFGSLGEQMVAVVQASKRGGQVDPRLYNVATGLGESVPSDGGLR